MSVTKKENGYWSAKGTVCLPDGQKRYYQKQFKLKKDAVAYEIRRREELLHESPSMTLDAFVSQQNERDRLRIKESTLILREGIYRIQIQPTFGELKLTAISAPMVERWYADLLDQLAYSTANHVMTLLSGYLNCAIRLDLIPSNPCAKVRRIHKDPNAIDEDPGNYWTPDDHDAFVEACPRFKHMDQLNFLWATGVRIGECLALQWRHYDGKSIQIKQSLSSTSFKITSPKTPNSVRTILLDDKTIAMLDRRKQQASRIDGWTEDWYIFGSYKPQSTTPFGAALARAFKKHPELKQISVHGLRHSHASLLINNGIPDMVIADRLGHTVDMLHKTYAHLYDKSRQDIVGTLNRLL